MRARKQPHLPGFEGMGIKEFGGVNLRGNAREARPLSAKRPIHLVMRSSLAKGPRSFLNPRKSKRIEDLVRAVARKKSVRIYRYANSGNHLHFLVRAKTRETFKSFLRAITGLIARIALGVERGKALGLRFWDARPFTRIVEWGKDFVGIAKYLLQNTLEAIGFLEYRPRKRRQVSAKPRGPDR